MLYNSVRPFVNHSIIMTLENGSIERYFPHGTFTVEKDEDGCVGIFTGFGGESCTFYQNDDGSWYDLTENDWILELV